MTIDGNPLATGEAAVAKYMEYANKSATDKKLAHKDGKDLKLVVYTDKQTGQKNVACVESSQMTSIADKARAIFGLGGDYSLKEVAKVLVDRKIENKGLSDKIKSYSLDAILPSKKINISTSQEIERTSYNVIKDTRNSKEKPDASALIELIKKDPDGNRHALAQLSECTLSHDQKLDILEILAGLMEKYPKDAIFPLLCGKLYTNDLTTINNAIAFLKDAEQLGADQECVQEARKDLAKVHIDRANDSTEWKLYGSVSGNLAVAAELDPDNEEIYLAYAHCNDEFFISDSLMKALSHVDTLIEKGELKKAETLLDVINDSVDNLIVKNENPERYLKDIQLRIEKLIDKKSDYAFSFQLRITQIACKGFEKDINKNINLLPLIKNSIGNLLKNEGQARKYIEEKQLPEIMNFVDRLIQKVPLYDESEMINAAKEILGEVIKNFPENAAAHHAMARVCIETKDWNTAKLHLQLVLKAQPENLEAFSDFSIVLQHGMTDDEKELAFKVIDKMKSKSDLSSKEATNFYNGVTRIAYALVEQGKPDNWTKMSEGFDLMVGIKQTVSEEYKRSFNRRLYDPFMDKWPRLPGF